MTRMSRPLHTSLVIALAAVSAACATTGATPAPFPRPHAPAPPAEAPGSPNPTPRPSAGGAPRLNAGYEVTGTALRLRGTPYRNGGSDPAGFDCSGFVKYVFGENGINVPRKVSDQFRAGRNVDTQQLQAGDLVFFTTVSPGASHVGIVIGGDEFVHAPSGAGEVRVERLSASYWSTRFVGARRVL
jgi:cell wall-associated NlpC family hydrolase